MTNLPNYLKA